MSTDLLNMELLLEDELGRFRDELVAALREAIQSLSIQVNTEPQHIPTPEEVAQAIAKVVAFPQPLDTAPVLGEMAEATRQTTAELKGVGKKLKALSMPVVSGGTVTVNNSDSQPVAVAASDFEDIKRGITDYETRLDYGARTDDQPVYVGRAPQGTATTNTDWYIERITYDGSNRPTRSERLSGSWDNRGSL